MPVYPKHIADAIREAKSCRRLGDANAVGAEAKFDCGCLVRVEMVIGTASEVCEIGYSSNGCGYMVAAAESLASKLRGVCLSNLHGEIKEPSNGRLECSEAVVRAVKSAFADYRSRRIEEFRGEKALICTCFGVTEYTIEQFVRSSHPRGVNEVSDALRAGGGCGSCRMLIQEIIDANR